MSSGAPASASACTRRSSPSRFCNSGRKAIRSRLRPAEGMRTAAPSARRRGARGGRGGARVGRRGGGGGGVGGGNLFFGRVVADAVPFLQPLVQEPRAATAPGLVA